MPHYRDLPPQTALTGTDRYPAPMEPVRVQVDDANQQAWIAVAHSTRIDDRVLNRLGDPSPGSNFARAAELFPVEKVADRARAYLRAGLDHMPMWADYSAPLLFHDEQTINFTLRPTLTLARAALEASAQAVWLVEPPTPSSASGAMSRSCGGILTSTGRARSATPPEQAAIELRRQELVRRYRKL